MKTLTRDEDRQLADRDVAVPQLYVLVECDRIPAGSSRHLLDGITRVDIGRGDRRVTHRTGQTLSLEIPDARMSQPHARLVKQGESWVAEDSGSKNGLIVDGERRARVPLSDGAVLELGHTLLLYRETPLPATAVQDLGAEDLAAVPADRRTFVPALQRAYDDLAAVVTTSVAVLIQGETGTGKERVARAAHELARRTGSFVAVNCGALPETLIESELFGSKRGAFSGADHDRPGLVRSADGGTLFLDEVADLPLPSQAALLRVLQEREVVPVGATQPIPVDLQVVAASHHDLADRVQRDLFRRDLYARLAAFTIRMPPLRDRREDLGLLLAALLPPDARISPSAAHALADHDWPLNIRELASCLVVATALARGGPIKLEHLPETIGGGPELADAVVLAPEEQRKRDEIVALLREHRGNVSAISRATGKARAQIHRWLRRFQLDPDTYR